MLDLIEGAGEGVSQPKILRTNLVFLVRETKIYVEGIKSFLGLTDIKDHE